ncbi:MAG: hypothetical protein FJY66_01520 [Calditrichaeota bacterium]|nr:hypothetical protein [Calditrichota bacterium]
MRRVWIQLIGLACLGAVLLSSCTEGINDYPDAAKVTGWVFTDGTESQGVAGVTVLLESDEQSDNAYTGPDRWFYTDENGHFEGSLYLGSERNPTTGKETYRYLADVAISYYYDGKYFSWSGGATVQAGGNFICPSVNLTQFIAVGSGGGG